MKVNTGDEKILRKYLLGDLSPEEQQEVELQLMSDEDAYDLLVAAEDDLIDASIAGKLKGDELERFNNYFLAAGERQRKLQFGRSLERFVRDPPRSAASPESPARDIFWGAVTNFLRYRPAIAYAASAVVVLLIVGSIWSVFRIVALQRQLHSATAQLADVGRERDETRRQLGESESLGERMRAQVQALEETLGATKSSVPQALLAFNLIPGLSRSSSDIPKIAISANASLLQFSLSLLDDNYDSYRAALRDAGGQELWTRDRLSATATRDGKAVVLTVPIPLLSNGDYSFSLMGISDSRPPESISSFYFRVVRQ